MVSKRKTTHSFRHLLLVSSLGHALQIFRLPSGVIPDDPHVYETFPAPEEICSIPSIVCDDKTIRTVLSPGDKDVAGDELVISAGIMQRGLLWDQHGPLVALL